MPDSQTSDHLTAAIANLRSAETCLDEVITRTGDPEILKELNTEYGMLTGLVAGLVQAQTLSDNGAFTTATAALNTKAADLKAQEAHIKKIITDVATAAKVVGYIAQAVTFVEAL
jgi:hypothetical protein